jgi:Mn-dependent DtxR family transcriptional regulator
MTKESDVLKIVKEDILRCLGEEKTGISLEFVISEINVSNIFISKAVEELKKGNLIKLYDNFILLTKKGKEKAKDIVKKHIAIENYFKETNNKIGAHKAAHILEHYVSKKVIDNMKKLYTFKHKSIPLTEFEIDKEVMITDIVFSDYGVFERIVSMGIFPGEKIKISNIISNNIIIKVENKKIVMSKDIAKGIKVYGEN